MLLELDEIPRRHNFYASLFTWLILAGYIVFPGTFTSLKSSNSVQEAASKTHAGEIILDTVQNASLLWIAGACCLFGVVGIALLWKRWKRNYIWPTLLNAILGLVNSLINVYTAKDGNWSVTATITVTITSGGAVLTSKIPDVAVSKKRARRNNTDSEGEDNSKPSKKVRMNTTKKRTRNMMEDSSDDGQTGSSSKKARLGGQKVEAAKVFKELDALLKTTVKGSK
ncbi:hypothetical protein CLAIMM_03150 [Cladophialophora immunda]|nr:hypothetical protein CLAIMM_03150 [Cladophialophora immunda]